MPITMTSQHNRKKIYYKSHTSRGLGRSNRRRHLKKENEKKNKLLCNFQLAKDNYYIISGEMTEDNLTLDCMTAPLFRNPKF